MRIKVGQLRRIIRSILLESPPGASGTDPTKADGFYPYELERGTDVFGFKPSSPGDKGDNPMRPEDPEEYIGFKTKGVKPEDAAAEAAPPPVGGEPPA